MTERLSLAAFGRAVRARRRELGLSQEELGRTSRLHRTYVSGVELGHRNLSLLNLVALAAALDLQPSELLADAEQHGERPR